MGIVDSNSISLKICTRLYYTLSCFGCSLRWRHNGRDSVSNHQPRHCLLSFSFRRRSKKTSKLRVTGLCVGISPGNGEFPAQMARNAENVSIWWRHHGVIYLPIFVRVTPLTSHGSDTALLCASFQNDRTVEQPVTGKRYSARIEFKMRFAGLSYIAQDPWV